MHLGTHLQNDISLCVCVHVCRCVCIHKCPCECRSQRILSSCTFHVFLESGSFTSLELIKKDRLSGQQVPGSHRFLHFQCWDYKVTPVALKKNEFWGSISHPCACKSSTLLAELFFPTPNKMICSIFKFHIIISER